MSYPHDDGPIILQGAPDESTSPSGDGTNGVQVMQLDMSNEVLEELLACVRSGKQPHITFGINPMLRFGSHTHTLETRNSKFRHEIYRSNKEHEDQWQFAGLVTHSLNIRKAEDASAGMDEALALLKNNMATIKYEREVRRTLVTPELSSTKRFKSSHTNSRLSSSHLHPSRTSSQQSGDIGQNGNRLSSNLTASPSHPAESERNESIHYALIHLLAMESSDMKSIAEKLHVKSEQLAPMLKKVAEEDKASEWMLSNKAYKELDPWKFPYPKESMRQTAIDNAIRAFDRLRIDPKDKIWQMLLPEEERGQGKVLSKLKLQQPKISTPGMKPVAKPKSIGKVLDRKASNPKRPETKAKDKEGEKERERAPAVHKAGREKIQNGRETPKRDGSKQQSKTVDGKLSRGVTSTSQKPSVHRPVKDARPSTSTKGLPNKPKNRSPLSASPVNASDFEDNHPVHKALSAAASPPKTSGTKSLKRKVGAVNSDVHRDGAVKKSRVGPPISTPMMKATGANGTPSSKKRKPVEDSSSSLDNTPLKVRKMANGDSMSRARSTPSGFGKSIARPRSAAQISDESSLTSPEYSLSLRQRLELAEKFQRYYGRYRKLYLEIKGGPEAPTKAQKEELLRMHNSLADMKAQMASGSIRG